MAERRYRALLVANGTFPEDPERLRPLKGPANDVKLLLEALTDRHHGLHTPGDVQVLVDEPKDEIVEVMEAFFVAAMPSDQLLLYYSGHGVPDRQDRLYLCAHNTRIDRLIARAISDQEITRMVEASKAQATAIVLDCCYSGSFKTSGPDPVDRLGGRGRFVLASSRAGELSDDASDVQGASLFTRHLVQGLLAGATVDVDGDGLITIADLYRYVSERLADEASGQRPHQRYDGDGALVLARAPEPLTTVAEPAVGLPPRLWNVPQERNPNFTGRERILQQLRGLLTGPNRMPMAITGLGGLGKTRLVVEYAVRHWSDYELVWWLRADNPTTLASDYAQLGTALGIDQHDPQLGAEQLRRLLADRDRWLLIFDNAEDPADLTGYLPARGGGHVLITARNPTWGRIATPIPLEVLDRHDATALLLKRSRQTDQQAAEALAEALGDLPIALEQAGAYLEATAMPLADYLALFQQRQEDLAAIGAPGSTERTVATTWSLAFDRVEQASTAAVQLLRLCAFLAPEDIPLNLLSTHTDLLPAELAETTADPITLNETIAVLRRHALVERKTDLLSIHRLVQVAVRHQLNSTDRQFWARVAVQLLEAAFPDKRYEDPDVWPACARLLSHAVAAAGHAKDYQVEAATTSDLLDRAAGYLDRRGRYTEAWALAERALELAETVYEPEDEVIATRLKNVAKILRAQGKLDTARTHYDRALLIYDARLGHDHPDTLDTRHNLGLVLQEQDQLDAAEAVYQYVLELRLRVLGHDHPDTLTTRHNLAFVHQEQGNLDQAEAEYWPILDLQRQHLGPDHPETLTTRHNLARVLQEQGKLDKAEEQFRTVFKLRRRVLGDDHRHTLDTRHALAWLLQARGQLDEAADMLRSELAFRQRVQGPDHRDAVRSREALAVVMTQLGDQRQP